MSEDGEQRAELDALVRQIRHHEAAYRAGQPEVTDAVFDELFDRYQALADQLAVPDSERIDRAPGADHTEGFVQVEHRVPMLSLEKLSPSRVDDDGSPITMQAQLAAWIARRRRDLELAEGQPLPLVIEPKVDGISVSLLYTRGELARAVTRGDGRRGDDITAQVRAAGAVPERLAGVAGTLEARGEIYWPSDRFVAYNDRLAAAGERRLANPRNGAAGMVKRKDPRELDGTGITSFLYQVPWADGVALPPRQSDVLAWLAAAGARVYGDTLVAEDAAAIATYCDAFAARKGELPYDIDGMVIKVDDLRQQERLLGTGHHPHWAVAYKFPPERKPSRLLGIHVQVGKTGKLTPVAELEPVALAGTSVSRASLHNFVELARKDVRVGDTVFVEKAGEIIPQVIGVDRAARPEGTSPYPRPTNCPACDTPVLEEEIFVYCPNPACPAQVRERLRHFASRGAMDIDGLGASLVDQVVEHLGVSSPEQLWSLTREQLAGLERMGVKSADNVLAGLERSKQRGMARVLIGLAIRHLGVTMSEDLAAYFRHVDTLLEFAARYASGDPDAIATVAPDKATQRGAIEGMARKTADSIFAELDSPAVRRVLGGLAAAGVSMAAVSSETAAVPGVAGKSFVLTGTLPTLKRSDAAERIKRAGGKVVGAVSKTTDYLVAGDEAGSKLEKAQKLGVAVIDEAALLAMFNAAG
jgi:DNA ligase (NAD+)